MSQQDDCIIKIAYADDHRLIRRGVANLLNGNRNFRIIIEAGNGEELLKMIREAAEPPDICILDISMPVMNGFATLAAIRESWPEIRTLILSGYDSDYYVMKMILAGANGYLLKDSAPDDLETALRSIYREGIYYSGIMNLKFYRAVKNKEVSLPELSGREEDFLRLCSTELSYSQIAGQLYVSPKTVDYYRSCLFRKFNVTNRTALVVCAIELAIIPLPLLQGSVRK